MPTLTIRKIQDNDPEIYHATYEDGFLVYTIQREEQFRRKWVARDNAGYYVDMDRFRNDLFERLEIKAAV